VCDWCPCMHKPNTEVTGRHEICLCVRGLLSVVKPAGFEPAVLFSILQHDCSGALCKLVLEFQCDHDGATLTNPVNLTVAQYRDSYMQAKYRPSQRHVEIRRELKELQR